MRERKSVFVCLEGTKAVEAAEVTVEWQHQHSRIMK